MTDTTTTPVSAIQPITFKHETMPDWGVGLLVQDAPPYWVLFFENAGEKKFVKDKAKVLVPVAVTADTLATLKTRASGRKPKPGPKPSLSLRPASRKPSAKKAAVAKFASFKDQVALFEKLFAGGFTGEAFTAEERGVVAGKASEYKQAAIELAQKELSAAAFANTPADELFAKACAVLAATNIVFPIEGPIPFRKLAGADREKAMAALKDLLHGTAPFGERVERFAVAVNLKDAAGGAKKVTWPLATIFAGLFDPTQYTCVKPTAFAAQALQVGVTVDKTQAVNAAGYALFLEVAKKTQALLIEAGQKPRDLMDVYTFIWRTHAEKPAA